MTQPYRYIIRMVVFLVLVLAAGGALFKPLREAFEANPALNGMILVVLVLGIIYVFRQVITLKPEVDWLDHLRKESSGGLIFPGQLSETRPPRLLGPMATMVGERKGRLSLSALSMRTLLDSIKTRIDESHDISRYLIGLLVFLGLLGTFWGLLETVSAVGSTISGLTITSDDSNAFFEDLKTGLETPLAGMGTAFSSSLFGLAGSLVLGFLELQAAQAHNRFMNDLEEWLSGVTRLSSGGVGDGGGDQSVPAYLQALLEQTADSLDVLQRTIARGEDERQSVTMNLVKLTEQLGTMTDQMRTEQGVLLRLAETQSQLKPLLMRLSEMDFSMTGIDDATRSHIRNLDFHMERLVGDVVTGREQTVQEIRMEIRLLARTIAAIAEEEQGQSMYELGRGSRRSVNIWPGFVDGLASLLMVVIFVLMVFMVAQFFLRASLTGKDEALDRLNREVSELAELLALERAANADLRINVAQLSSELQSSLAQRDTLSNQLSLLIEERDAVEAELRAAASEKDSLASQLAALIEERDSLEKLLAEAEASTSKTEEELRAAYETIEADKAKIETQLAELAILKSLRDDMTRQLAEMEAALTQQEEAADVLRAEAEELRAQAAEAELARTDQAKLTDEAQSKVDLLNRQISALRLQLARLAVALEAAEAQNAERDVQIADLGRRLNVALATKVQELSRYRSEFFGRLREVLGSRSDIRIVGDRFVFQSELLFETGFAELGEPGKVQLRQLAQTLNAITGEIPDDIDWILRVDGHTDKRPIVTTNFPSNWELSTARAISVVKFLIEQGIPRERLAATGFGEFQPLDPGEDEIAYRRNRRIEFKFTQK